MKKIICTLLGIVIILAGASWTKEYSDNRYTVSNSYYTQIPSDEVNEDSWLLDMKGKKQELGKEYYLIVYDKEGNKREVSFSKKGKAKDYYAPGTYIKVDTSKTISLKESIVNKEEVPSKALENIEKLGTKR
ncbi:YxeA family protein [Romboutsia lituseburensis]|nr:YxeA family protein [Romboutsia lituseburensis]